MQTWNSLAGAVKTEGKTVRVCVWGGLTLMYVLAGLLFSAEELLSNRPQCYESERVAMTSGLHPLSRATAMKRTRGAAGGWYCRAGPTETKGA